MFRTSLRKWWKRESKQRKPARRGVRGFRPTLELLEDRVVLNSVMVTLVNASGSALVLNRSANATNATGSWITLPPNRIESGATATWKTDSNSDLLGTEGEATYTLENSVFPTEIDWDNPFIGSNSYSETAPTGYHASYTGGSGTVASVTFTFSILDSSGSGDDLDSSGDGIPDAWKTQGIPESDGQYYQLPGATVGHKDLYVEVDAMQTFQPQPLPPISAASDSAPIVITTSTPNGLSTGTHVTIAGVGGDTAANGEFTVQRVNSTQFRLEGSAGNGVYSGGGTWSLTDITNADNTVPTLKAAPLETGTDLDLVVNAFLNAPVTNPDGTTGIYLHIENDAAVQPDGSYALDGQIPAAAWTTYDASAWPTGFDAIKDNTSSTVPGGFGAPAERADPNATAILEAKALVYRYTIFGQSYSSSGSSGLADLPGSDFMVTLGAFPINAETQASGFMHEFGHTLGLGHGGEVAPQLGTMVQGSPVVTGLADTSDLLTGMVVSLPSATADASILSVDSPTQITLTQPSATSEQGTLFFADNNNYKPNYQSIMNYEWNFPSPVGSGSTPAQIAFNADWQLNYSTEAYNTLDENNLDEAAGIGGTPNLTEAILPSASGYQQWVSETGPVDWNGNGTTNDVHVSQDLNNDGSLGILQSYVDWPNLIYNVRQTYAFGDGGHALQPPLDNDALPLGISSVLTYQAAPGQGPNDVTLRLNGANLEILDDNSQTVVVSKALANTTLVDVFGADGEENSLTVDFGFGGFFSVAGGIEFSGGAGNDNSLRIIGTGQSTGSYAPDSATPGNGTAQVSQNGQSVAVGFTGLGPVQISNMASYQFAAPGASSNITLGAGTGSGGQTAETISGTSGGVPFDPLTFFNIPSFTITASGGGNTTDVQSNPNTLTISQSGGGNSVKVEANAGTMAINYSSGGSNTTNVQANAGTVTVNDSNGGGNLNISGNAGTINLPYRGVLPAEQVMLGNAGSMAGIQGTINLDAFNKNITANDNADAQATAWTIGNIGTFTAPVYGLANTNGLQVEMAQGNVSVPNQMVLNVSAGSSVKPQDDLYPFQLFNGTSYYYPVSWSVNGNGSTLEGPDALTESTAWDLTGQDSGTISYTLFDESIGDSLTFTGMANLIGGAPGLFSPNSHFTFEAGASVSGNLDGGSGVNTLDYSAYGAPFHVDLVGGSATAVGGKVSDIQVVTPDALPFSNLINPVLNPNQTKTLPLTSATLASSKVIYGFSPSSPAQINVSVDSSGNITASNPDGEAAITATPPAGATAIYDGNSGHLYGDLYPVTIDIADSLGNTRSQVFDVVVAHAYTLTVSPADAQLALPNAAYAGSFQATVTDELGNPVPGLPVRFDAQMGVTGASGTFAGGFGQGGPNGLGQGGPDQGPNGPIQGGPGGSPTAFTVTDGNGVATVGVVAKRTPFIANGAVGAFTMNVTASGGLNDNPLATGSFTLANVGPPTVGTPTASPATPITVPSGVADQVDVGVSLTLGISASADPNVGGPLTYAWTLLAPAGSTVTLDNPAAASPTFTPDMTGTYTAEVTVTDRLGHSTFNQQPLGLVAVPAPPPTVGTPTASPATPITVASGVADRVDVGVGLTLAVSASPDPNVGGSLSYAWTLLDPAGSTATLDNPAAASPSFTPDVTGTYTAEVTVTDRLGHSTFNQQPLGLVAVPAPPPTVGTPTASPGTPITVASGVADQVDVGVGLMLGVSASPDPNVGGPLTYAWTLLLPAGSTATLDNAAAASPSFTPDMTGTYTAEVTVTDRLGHSTFNEQPLGLVAVPAPPPTVGTPTAAPATPVTVQFGVADQVDVGVGLTLGVTASADPNVGGPLSYAWTLETPTGSTAALDNSTAAAPHFTPDVTGNYSVEVTVMDRLGHSTSNQQPLALEADTTFSVSLDAATPQNLVLQDTTLAAGSIAMPVIQADTANRQFVISDPNSQFTVAAGVAGPLGTLSADGHTVTVPFANVPGQIVFNSGQGTDTLTVDYSKGSFPVRTITVNGGGNGTLDITGPAFGTEQYDYTNAHDGTVFAGAIDYTGLASINNTSPVADVTLNLPPGAQASLEAAGAGLSELRSLNQTFALTTFSNFPTGTLSINAAGNSTVQLATAPSFQTVYTGVDSDTFRFVNAQALPAATSVFDVTHALLDLNGFSTTIGVAQTNAVFLTGGTIATGSGTLTLAANIAGLARNDNQMPATINGNLSLGGVTRTIDVQAGNLGSQVPPPVDKNDMVINALISDGGLNKNNTGTLQLTDDNTYTGPTTVNAGALLVDGSQPASTITVNSSATLGGTGTTGPIIAAGGRVSPGDPNANHGDPLAALGTLSGTSADFSDGGNLTVQLASTNTGATDSDKLALSGALTLGGTSTLTLDLAGLTTTAGPITIVQDANRTGQFSTVTLINNPLNLQALVNYTATTVTVTLVYATTVGPTMATTSYSTSTQTLLLTGNVTSPNGPVNGGTFTFTVAGFGPVTSGNVTNGTASASFIVPAGTPAQTLTITTAYSGDVDFPASTDATGALTVTRATPIITWSNPAAITVGTPLGVTQLNAVADVPGTFAYTPSAGSVLTLGAHQALSVSFTPADSVDYTTASATVYIDVVTSTTTTPVHAHLAGSTAMALAASTALAGPAATPLPDGYWLVGGDGAVFSFGDAGNHGSTTGVKLTKSIVGMAATPSGGGYWLVGADGSIFTFGDAHSYGSIPGIKLTLKQPIVGMAATPSGQGYWLVGADGSVFSFGDAHSYGSISGIKLPLKQSIVGMAATPSGHGYWLVGGDGSIFSFGDAAYHGSTAGMKLKKPIVGMAATPSGQGYWLVGADGSVFSFGDAHSFGSIPGIKLALKQQPIVGMAATPSGGGYWLVGAGGSIFAFGDAVKLGSAVHPKRPIVGIVIPPTIQSAVYGHALVLTTRVTAPGTTTPTGMVDFVDTQTGADLGQAPLVGGSATLVVPLLGAANHTIVADYLGRTDFAASASVPLSLAVTRAAPVLTWSTPTAIPYGTALSTTQLDATADVAGTFVYTPAAGALLPLGKHQALTVTFTPTDTTDYTTAKATVYIDVNKATPAITWVTPAAITSGTRLTAAQLDATTAMAGTFAYKPVAGTLLKAGTYTLTVTFTPKDRRDYNKAHAQVILQVNKAGATVA